MSNVQHLHPNDPETVETPSDVADRAHQRVVEKLANGETVCKVTAAQILLECSNPDELLERLFGLGFLAGEEKLEATEQLIQDTVRVVNDFVASNDYLRDAELEDMEAEDRDDDCERNYLL